MSFSEFSEDPPLIEARNLQFSRHDEPIFGPLSFAVNRTDILLIEGDNGSGKTTLLRILAGLLPATSGELMRSGMPAIESEVDLVFLSHNGGLKLDLTARENLRFSIRLNGIRSGVSIGSALKSVGLQGFEATPLRFLSTGQRKRAALASILLSPAALWLLDEPYANLDREGHVLVDRLLETHARRGGSAVVTSHGLRAPVVAKISRLAMVNGNG